MAGIVDFGHVRPGRARDGETFSSILPTAFGTGVMPICEGLLVHVSTGRTCPLTVIAWRLGALPLAELWWRYVGLGGNLQRDALVDYLSGTASWPAFEHNVLAHVLNERLWELGCPSLAPNRTSDDHRRGVGSQAERGLRDAP